MYVSNCVIDKIIISFFTESEKHLVNVNMKQTSSKYLKFRYSGKFQIRFPVHLLFYSSRCGCSFCEFKILGNTFYVEFRYFKYYLVGDSMYLQHTSTGVSEYS